MKNLLRLEWMMKVSSQKFLAELNLLLNDMEIFGFNQRHFMWIPIIYFYSNHFSTNAVIYCISAFFILLLPSLPTLSVHIRNENDKQINLKFLANEK